MNFEFPQFNDAEDPAGWLCCPEQFFEIHSTASQECVLWTSQHLEDEAHELNITTGNSMINAYSNLGLNHRFLVFSVIYLAQKQDIYSSFPEKFVKAKHVEFRYMYILNPRNSPDKQSHKFLSQES
ncbi:hypothetical protein POM88_044758 [Heracleum sosnowskyi]|uniref:Uncharacterized protein n=1 Tax=Heracleum sosnowskyi TaxID=360622 RepID=A0AAD8H610_9APIA|nr:hypothetical protein POM88_044758 [Heracleum sosnowskyi]